MTNLIGARGIDWSKAGLQPHTGWYLLGSVLRAKLLSPGFRFLIQLPMKDESFGLRWRGGDPKSLLSYNG
jgi:hypothetical protein